MASTISPLPNHNPIRLGTLGGILKAVAAHHKLTLDDVIQKLDL
jgi:hypothetical protein